MPKRKIYPPPPPRLLESIVPPGVPSCGPENSLLASPDFSSAAPAATGVKSAGSGKNGRKCGHYKDAFREALGKCFTYAQKR